MKNRYLTFLLMIAGALPFVVNADSWLDAQFDWTTVVNNNDLMPPLGVRNFNSYNQPSVNMEGLVILRARSRGGSQMGPPTHGIYTRDMSKIDSPINSILDRTSQVPYPNNLDTTFIETPSFPRIDMWSDTIATRANHRPVWKYNLNDGTETRAGTTGIYTNPFGELISAVAKLGHVPEFSFYEVPEFLGMGIRFEVFPGAPSVAQKDTIVFKGNYTDPQGDARTGVYFRRLGNEPHGGSSPVIMIANNLDTLIPGTDSVFGSTSPPSAVGQDLVFAGFDNENAPTKGGIYLARLSEQSRLSALVSIGDKVQGESIENTFNHLGEGVAFDGRFVGFWGAWGEASKTVRLYCPQEGNKDRINFCNQQLVCNDTGEIKGDINSVCNDDTDANFGISCYQEKEVPVNQGIFAFDTVTGTQRVVSKVGEKFDEFLFWNYSGKTPCTGGGHSDEGAEDDGEPARWRSSAFVAVSSHANNRANFNAAFKARKGELNAGVYVDPVDGIYLRRGPGNPPLVTVLKTGMNGQSIDPEAPSGSVITEMGIERRVYVVTGSP